MMPEFPKPVMRAKELMEMGFPYELLRRAYGTRGQRFAMKLHPEKTNSPLVFFTEGFSQWLEKDIAAQDRGMRRG